MNWVRKKLKEEVKVLVDRFIKESKKEREIVTTEDVRNLAAMVVMEVLWKDNYSLKGGT